MFLPDSPTSIVGGTISGKLGSSVYAHGVHGPYSYQFTPRVDPATPLQLHLRTDFAALAIAWLNNNPAIYREAWEAYAAGLRVHQRQGSCGNPTGFNCYMGSQSFRTQNNGYLPPWPPTVYTRGVYHPLTFQLPLAPPYLTITAIFELSDPWRNHSFGIWGIYASPPLPSSVNYYKGPFQNRASAAGNPSRPPTSRRFSLVNYPVSGQVMFFRSRISEGDGRLSPPIVQRVYFP